MNCLVVYGLSRNIKHEVQMPVAEAFRKIRDHEFTGWAFDNIYNQQNRLVYTTQGLAGYRWICEDCPYRTPKGEKK
jgi:hypothetical protein